MRLALLVFALVVGWVAYGMFVSYESDEMRTADAAAAMARWRATLDELQREPRPVTAEDLARVECEARARMAAAVHRADPAQVREACRFTWRTTGALPDQNAEIITLPPASAGSRR